MKAFQSCGGLFLHCDRGVAVSFLTHPFLMEGSKIHASVSRDVLRMKRLDMDEGECFHISRVVVVPNDGKDRATNHAYRLAVDMYTIVVKVEPQTMTSYGLSPLTCSDIGRKKFETEYLVDKVGLLTSLTCEREYIKDDKDMVVVYMEITDPTGKIECVSYDEYVEDVRQFLKNEGTTTPIIIIQFARIVHHGPVQFGDAAIESVMGISRVMFSPGIPEVFDMRNWLAMSGFSLEAKLNLTDMETPNISLRDEFMLYHPRRDLDKLRTKGEAGVYVVWATITSILENDTWWYTVAKHVPCNTGGASLFKCDGYYTVIPKFKLKIEVCDGTDITNFIIGDEAIEKLLKTSCKDLLATLKGEDMSAYPGIFNRLIGQNMLFLVEKRTALCHVKDGCFKVNRVCSQAEIIRMYLRGEFFRVDRNVCLSSFTTPKSFKFYSSLPHQCICPAFTILWHVHLGTVYSGIF